jgi:hypothetical protein
MICTFRVETDVPLTKSARECGEHTQSGENARFITLSSAPTPDLLWKYTNPRTDRNALLWLKPIEHNR